MRAPARFVTRSAQETRMLGARLGPSLAPNSVVCMFGPLGAGKTTFIKGIVESLTENCAEDVSSPTYTYLNIYEGPKVIYHFDLYRLRDHDAFLGMGFDEYLHAGGICLVEWSERIRDVLPSHAMQVRLQHDGEELRTIEILGQVFS